MAMSLRDYDLDQLSAYDLIDVLDEIFPRTNAQPGDTLDYLMHNGGKRDLIETLLNLKEREQNG